ncbi:MAG: T9SS type A sorting domain-containing protein, partial [Bacteroidota bacterium]
MNKIYIVSLALSLICLSFIHTTHAQTFWTGPKITFTKMARADWNLEENQDRLTDKVWLTRQDRWPLVNIANAALTVKPPCTDETPVGTRWAFGTIADGVENLTFDRFSGANFTNCNVGRSGSPINRDAVLHLVEDDIYIDIKFLSWGSGNSGGGSFSYERSTDPSVSTVELEKGLYVTLYPNPAQETLRVIGMESIQANPYAIYSASGQEVQNGIFSPNEPLSIGQLPKGMYY